jgi:hypothetical protein
MNAAVEEFLQKFETMAPAADWGPGRWCTHGDPPGSGATTLEAASEVSRAVSAGTPSVEGAAAPARGSAVTELAGVVTSHGLYCIGCADCYFAPVHCQECQGAASKNYASLGRRHKPCGIEGIFVGWDDNHERIVGLERGDGRMECCVCAEVLPVEEERLSA